MPRRYAQTLAELFIGNFSYSSAATPWREFADAINRVAVSDTGERIAQPGFGVDKVEPGGLYERVDRGRPLAALVRAGEEVVLAAERHGSEAVLGAVVVRLEPGVVAEAGQRFAPLDRIANSVGERAFARDAAHGVLSPVEEAVDADPDHLPTFEPVPQR